MPHADREDQSKEMQSLSSLQNSLDKLTANAKNKQNTSFGMSSNFAQQLQSRESAMILCEKSMESLAGEYVDMLLCFKESTKPMETLRALERSETLWAKECEVIRQFDGDGGETSFLLEMREQAYHVMGDKLEDASRACSRNPNEENVAVCLALLGVMDSILGEFGRPIDSPERKRFRDIAKSFQ